MRIRWGRGICKRVCAFRRARLSVCVYPCAPAPACMCVPEGRGDVLLHLPLWTLTLVHVLMFDFRPSPVLLEVSDFQLDWRFHGALYLFVCLFVSLFCFVFLWAGFVVVVFIASGPSKFQKAVQGPTGLDDCTHFRTENTPPRWPRG